MRHTDITRGQTLRLKPARARAYGRTSRDVVVVDLRFRAGYKVPHVVSSAGECFTPADFSGIA